MAKLLYSYLFICIFVLSGFLAFSSAKLKTCTSVVKLGHPCDVESCINECFRLFNTGFAFCRLAGKETYCAFEKTNVHSSLEEMTLHSFEKSPNEFVLQNFLSKHVRKRDDHQWLWKHGLKCSSIMVADIWMKNVNLIWKEPGFTSEDFWLVAILMSILWWLWFIGFRGG